MAAQFRALAPEWRSAAARFLDGAGFERLCRYVDGRIGAGATIYPPNPLAALEAARPSEIRVVIVGQDPYHGPGQAHGLAFSVPAETRVPPSLRNILQEASRDCGCTGAAEHCLARWANQGVLLLNRVLTVEQGRPASHARCGWEEFTVELIEAVAREAEPKAFLLWGTHAQALEPAIRSAGPAHLHLVLTANHPSPLSARRPPLPFVGCSHFSAANAYLRSRGRGGINWCRGA